LQRLNELLHQLSRNYVLLSAGAVLFFGGKAILGYFAYRRYDRKLKRIERILNELNAKMTQTGHKP
jgi:hypothetical protein